MLTASFLALAASPALAQSSDEAVAEVLACEAVRGTKARLRCLEDALPALRAAHPEAVALAAERAEAARTAAAEDAKEEFGLTPAQREDEEETLTASADYEREAFGDNDLKSNGNDEDDEVEEINGVAIEIGRNNRGKLFVILDNGQVWRQIDGDGSSPYFPKTAEGLPITIKKGALGSYFVKIGKAKDTFKANRIK
jgi:hypothetical protein